MSRNTFSHNDDWLALGDGEVLQQYLSFNKNDKITPFPFLKDIETQGLVYQQFFTLNLQEFKQSRQVFTVLDVLAEIGGFLGFFQSLGAFLSSLFQEKLKRLIVASEMFLMDPDSVKYPSKKPKYLDMESS